MTAKEKLIKFMELKAEKIKELSNNTIDYYFTEEDKKDILNWDNKIAEKIWTKIKSSIKYLKASGLSRHVCPFCIYYKFKIDVFEKCINCTYGQRHGYCFLVDSDYDKISKTNIKYYLTNDWYLKIIKLIEEK